MDPRQQYIKLDLANEQAMRAAEERFLEPPTETRVEDYETFQEYDEEGD